MTPASITLCSQKGIVNSSSRSIVNYGSKCNNIGCDGGIFSTAYFCQSDVNMANLSGNIGLECPVQLLRAALHGSSACASQYHGNGFLSETICHSRLCGCSGAPGKRLRIGSGSQWRLFQARAAQSTYLLVEATAKEWAWGRRSSQ